MTDFGLPLLKEPNVEIYEAPYVVDREHVVWKIVRDGGMATKADYNGITSIGIEELQRTKGPLVVFDAARYVAWITGEHWKEQVSTREAIRSELIRQHMAGECEASDQLVLVGKDALRQVLDHFTNQTEPNSMPTDVGGGVLYLYAMLAGA